MAQECYVLTRLIVVIPLLNEVPEHMAQEYLHLLDLRIDARDLLNEVPEHMAQEFFLARALLSLGSIPQ